MTESEQSEQKKEITNCTPRSIEDFPTDFFTYEQRRYGAVILHAFLGFYCFVLTAMVCHDYLLPSLDFICIAMNISTDVAGATFLAMASCFPELFVNIIGTFLTESDLGVGTAVGSAVFDTFATPACGALMALHAIPLEWRILSRDCTMYVISVGTLVIVTWDRIIVWYEATILLVLLVIYLFLLFSSRRIALCCGKIACFSSNGHTISTAKRREEKFPALTRNRRSKGRIRRITVATRSLNQRGIRMLTDRNGSRLIQIMEKVLGIQKNGRKRKSQTSMHLPTYYMGISSFVSNATKMLKKRVEEIRSPLFTGNLFAWPRERTNIGKFWFVLIWPLKFLLFVTIPDVRRERLSNWYPVTFVMCVIWIAIASYLVSWMMTVIGDTIGIPDSIMGITFLAAGGNMPEVASIIILSKQGDGNMAMSNTLGANILDILLCLGLPWTIKCLMQGNVKIVSGALSYSVLSMIACTIILYAVIAMFHFKLNKKVGFICLLLYTIFLVFAILVELNVFFFVNPPMCEQ
ncbi:sodium/potassium/calcium exchanger 4 [Calliopsis andreniformis]|uniref:sodium/potassium/calcium exchanger 4 n=1 Tax=Calliopsis andreniformis TaxID=337506 RepID=UPI003FCD7694